jgi:O-antigen ligase
MLAGLVVAAMARDRGPAAALLAALGVAGSIVAVPNIAVSVQALLTHTFNLVTPPAAVYASANSVPLYLEPLVAYALPLAFLSEDRRLSLPAAGFLVVASAAIALSFSRAGWLTFIALLLLAALFTRRRLQVIVLAVGASALVFAGFGGVRRRILVELNPTSPENSLMLRLSLWKSALNLLRHRPLTGGGLAGFKRSVAEFADPAYHEDQIYPHNLLLNFWAETGLLGLVAFVWLVVQAVRLSLQGLRRTGWARIMAIGALGMILSLFVHGLVDIAYFKNDEALAFWTLLGIQLGSLREPRQG